MFGASAAHSPALKRSPPVARGATTAAIGQKGLQILSAVVIGNFLTRFDLTQCHDHNPAAAAHRFRIRSTGVVYVSRHIPSRRSVDDPLVVEREHVSGAPRLTSIGFFRSNAAAAISCDVDSSLYSLCREQTKPSH